MRLAGMATFAAIFACLAFPARSGLAQSAAAPPGEAAQITSLPAARLGIRTAPLILLSRDDVRAELSLTPEQTAGAEKALTALHARALATKQMQPEVARAERKVIDDAQAAWVKSNLSPDQLVRLSQIDLQWEGPSALVSRPMVGDVLGLTPEQRSALTRAVEARNAARATANYDASHEKTLAEQTIAILTEPQKSRWKTILGKPFAVELADSSNRAKARR